LTRLSFAQSKQHIIVLSLVSKNQIAFPVTKVLTAFDSRTTFIDASYQDTLVYTGTTSLSIALDLLWKITVLDIH
ncbi:hypothetical protein SB57_11260, partial [Lactobacillus delbrueckii subsp. bulgaricus]